MKSGKSQELDFVLVNLLAHTGASPNWQTAIQHRKMYSVAGTDKGQLKPKNALKFDTQNFNKYGSGVRLYFSLLKMLFYTFLLIGFISIPAFLCNLKGNGLTIYGSDSFAKTLMRGTLANQRYEEFQKVHTDSSIYLDIQVSHIIIIISDLLGSLTFFFFLILWRIKSDEIVEQQISQDALPSYYTLFVSNLPQGYTEESMKNHFEKMGGQVAQITTVYDYENILNEIKNFLSLVEQYSMADLKKKQKIYEEIAIIYLKIKQISQQKTPKPVMSIITFEDMIIKKKIRDIYKYRICPRQLKYKQKMIKVSNCKIQPSSILWQNFHLKLTTQIMQGICIYLILILILFATLIALFLVNARSTNVMEHQTHFIDTINYQQQYTYSEAKANGSVQVVYNFCSKLNYQTSLLQYSQLCAPYFDSYKLRIGWSLMVALLVVIINILCNWIIYELANYRRYKNKTQKSRFLILNIFILYFINSALLILLIRLEVGGLSLGKAITSIFHLPAEQFSIQSYDDFNRKWYMNIGSQILMIHVLSLMLSPYIQLVVGWAQLKMRFIMAKRAKTQKQMNQTLKDSEFDFQTFYAMTLNSCFFTMFYGNAMPILYILAALGFFSIYFASYLIFKYFSCVPMMFNHTLNLVISKIMCIALVVHQFTSIIYFYTEQIFPLSHSTINETNKHSNKFANGVLFLVLMTVFIVFGINYNRACRICKQFYYKYIEPKAISQYDQISQQINSSKKKKLFRQVFGRKSHSLNNYSYLSSYKMEMNPLYLDICYTMNILKMFHPYFDREQSFGDIVAENMIKSYKAVQIPQLLLNEEEQNYIQKENNEQPIKYYSDNQNQKISNHVSEIIQEKTDTERTLF